MKKLFIVLITAAIVIIMSVSALAQSVYTLTVNGKKLTDMAYQESNSEEGILIPVRAVGEALGFDVVWNAEDKSIYLNNGSMQTTLTVGADDYIASTSIDGMAGMTAPFSLGQAPKIVDGIAYVPAGIFVPLLGNDDSILRVKGNNINISTEKVINTGNNEIPNPIKEHKTIDELNKAVGFDIKLPKIGDDYKITFISDISGDLAQVVYSNGSNEITYRMSKGNDDISGDYNVYNNIKIVELNGTKVTLKGDEGKYRLALWTKDNYAYSLGFYDNAVTEKTAAAIAESIKF